MPSIRVLAAALGLSVSMLVAPAAQADVVTGGQVDWGIRESFRDYVMGPFPAGSITVSAPATQPDAAGPMLSGDGGGPFRFPISGGDAPGAGRVSVGTEGKVRFTGHGEVLDFTAYNVRVVFDGTSAGPCVLLDADTKNRSSGRIEAYRDVPFAKLNPAGITPTSGGGTTTWANVPATLTAEGSPAFAGFYQPGDPLDPVTFAYTTGAGSGTPGACAKRGSVVTVPPGAKPPASKPAGATVKLGKPSKRQLRLLAAGKAVSTKVRVSQAGKVTLTAKGRIARKTRTAAKAAKRARKAGVVTLKWKLGKGARRELAKKKKLRLKLTAALPGVAKPAAQRFTLKAPKARRGRR